MVQGSLQDAEIQYCFGAVIEPAVPYVQGLDILQHGQTIWISGFTQPTAKLFVIDLETKSGDIALHTKVWFQRGIVVRNTRSAAKWGPEETHGGFPLVAGDFFECSILVHDDCFKLALNGQYLADYKHCIPRDSVCQLHIHGDVSRLHSVWVTPSPREKVTRRKAMPALQEVPQVDSEEAKQFKMLPGGYDLHVPYSVLVPEALFTDRVIYLSVLPKSTAKRFTVNLRCGDMGDIALHLDSRFEDQKVIRNSSRGGGWGPEETEGPPFPLKPGKHCDVLIWVTDKAFLIAMNNQHFATFRHRFFELEAVNTLQVTGDVSLLHVRIR